MIEVVAFTAEQVCRLTGLSERQLRYWDKTEFFTPQYADEDRRRPFSRVYSFQDLVGLRTIALLRNKYRVPTRELRDLGAWLAARQASPWSSLTFYVSGRHVFFDDPVAGERLAGRPPGQRVFPLEMEKIAREAREAANKLRDRSSEEIGKVVQHRYILQNSPIIAGTRIPTSAIWNFYEEGYDTEAIIREYPRLTPDDVHAALVYEQKRQKTKSAARRQEQAV